MIANTKTGTITKSTITKAFALLLMLVTLSAMFPLSAFAQDDKRQKTKNDWRNIAIAAAGVGAVGLLKHDPRIGFAGAAGALYSLNRYEQDRKSQSKASQARASIFSHSTVYRNGHRYDRQLVKRNGKKYYRLVRN